MAIGAKKAFEASARGDEQKRLLGLPFMGCDGLPATGQSWVRSGLLQATVFVPPNTDLALQTLVEALRNATQPAERTFTTPVSFPALAELSAKKFAAQSGF